MNSENVLRRVRTLALKLGLGLGLAACSGEVLLGQELPPEQQASTPATNTEPAGEPGQMQGAPPGTGFGMGGDRRFAEGDFVDPAASTPNLGDEQWGLGRGEQFDGEQNPDGEPDVTESGSRGGDAGPPFDMFGNSEP